MLAPTLSISERWTFAWTLVLYIKIYFFTRLGVAFWIAADLGESSSSTFEQHVMKVFLSAGLNISSCSGSWKRYYNLLCF